jgi:hypothetical protein
MRWMALIAMLFFAAVVFADRGHPAAARAKIFARQIPCRNTIYYQHGYCFQTDRGRQAFSNDRCSTNAITELKLNPVEQANVTPLEGIEQRKGCR